MKKRVLVDVNITCDPPNQFNILRRYRTMEDWAKEYERWVREFHEFIRDHRSQDPVNLEVNRVYEDQCEFCGNEWEEDETGCPCCCNKAIEEWERNQTSIINAEG